ncbi:amino acid permease [Halobacterium bonnevillei]|uniref:Amino acid permease n=1 Tax=Halobacterium bonnevillei TaxID=2692200 RepID=A0A6B0SE49_9EURY|nr:amino acid permease [Halobacterium bonnevillei]MXR19207.1 amino acid permease [Halobacterium bonnevillei]
MADQQQELARDLGFLEAYTIGLGTMIGAGIFVLPSIAADAAGPASMISFLIGGVVSLLAALSLSELATGMPKAGGSYYYVNRALGGFFGSIVGWGMWGGLMFASAFYMLGFGQYLTYFVPMGATGVAIAALGMAALLVAVNYYGVKETGALQNVIVIALVGLIIVFVAFGVLNVDMSTLRPFNPEGWGAVAATAGTVYVTFIGFEVIATSAEEIKNPSRNLPLSMIAAVVTPTLLYVLVMFVSTGTLSIDLLADSSIPVADVAEEFLGSVGALAMVVGAVLATVSSANASILSAARVNFAMGRDNILTNWLNEVHNRFRTPYRAILATGVFILALIASPVPIGTLAEVASFSYLVTYSLVHVSVMVMRRADPEDYDPAFQIPDVLYPVVPAVGFVASLAILAQMNTVVTLVGITIVGVGVVWYLGYARNQDIKEGLVGEAIAPEPTPATTNGGGDGYRVVVPLANPKTERDLLRFAAASAHAHEDGDAELVAVNVIEVPRQTSLEQDVAFEEERVSRQQELLDQARDIAAELDVGLRTRAIVSHDAGDAILDVVEDEDADHVVLGWRGSRTTREHVLGSTLDPVVERSSCEASLINLASETEPDRVGDVVALVGEGPNAPVTVRRAAEFAAIEDDATLALLNIQAPDADADADASPEERGRDLIERVAAEVSLDVDYDTEVVVGDDVEATALEAVDAYDTVCVGATREGAVSQTLFGSLPETLGERASGTVVMAQGASTSPQSIREAIIERLSR